MIKGFKTYEFSLIVLVAFFAIAVSTGWLTPEKISGTTAKVQQTTEAVPALIASVKELVASLAPLAGLAGLAWAYLRRRTTLKEGETGAYIERLKIDAEVNKVMAQREVALAKLGRTESRR